MTREPPKPIARQEEGMTITTADLGNLRAL